MLSGRKGNLEADAMQDHLNHEKIKEAQADIDETMLNTALEAIGVHGFLNKRIGEITIAEVYDGTNIKSEIVRDRKKGPAGTSDDLRDTLITYIDYLKNNHYSVNPNDLLFPWYVGSSGEKKLRRHIGSYSKYRDTNALKIYCRGNINRQLVEEGKEVNQRINDMAEALGKSARSIRKTVSNATYQSQQKSQKTGLHVKTMKDIWKSKAPSLKDNIHKFAYIDDLIVVLPELDALDTDQAEIWIRRAFDLLDSDKTNNRNNAMLVNRIKYSFIKRWHERVEEIEKDLIEERKVLQASKGRPVKPPKPLNYAQLISEAVSEHAAQSIQEAESAIGTPSLFPSIAEPTNEMLDEKIQVLLNDIRRVKDLVPPKKWQKWEENCRD